FGAADPHHAALDDRVFDPEFLCEPRVQHGCSCPRPAGQYIGNMVHYVGISNSHRLSASTRGDRLPVSTMSPELSPSSRSDLGAGGRPVTDEVLATGFDARSG